MHITSTIAKAPPTIAPTSNWGCFVSTDETVSLLLLPMIIWVVVVISLLTEPDVIMSLVMLVVVYTGWEGGVKYPGHSGSSNEASKTTQVSFIFSRAWCTGRVTTSDDVIHCSIYIMTSLAIVWALSWTLALRVTWFGDPWKHWNSALVMLVCSSSQDGQCWLTPLAIPTRTSWTLSSGSLI